MPDVCIIGCGKLGSFVTRLLCENRIFDEFHLIDYDIIRESDVIKNVYEHEDIGLAKCFALSNELNSRYSFVRTHEYNRRVMRDSDIPGLVTNSFIIDCRDKKNNIQGVKVRISLDGNCLILDSYDNFIHTMYSDHSNYYFKEGKIDLNTVYYTNVYKIIYDYFTQLIYTHKYIRRYNVKSGGLMYV